MGDLPAIPRKSFEALSDRERAFVICYVESGYNLSATVGETGGSVAQAKKMMAVPEVRKAILEVQEDIDSIDFLNEKWVKAQILRLFPMVMGVEETPALDSRDPDFAGPGWRSGSQSSDEAVQIAATSEARRTLG